MSSFQTYPQTIEYWLPVIEEAVGGYHVVELIETRLSWLYLTSQHVYKIKKPLDIGLSHNWCEAHRRQACLDEVRLNERLAPGVYLGVIPITEEPNGEIRLNGHGLAIEYAIKMRRLHCDQNLAYLIEHETLSEERIHLLGQVLVEFYKGLPPESIAIRAYTDRLSRRIHHNADTLRNVATAAWRTRIIRMEQELLQFLDRFQALLNVRVCDGRIVDGHGDLRADHIFFERRPLIIDCIEYSATGRTLDALDDLARLAVDCEYLGRGDIGEKVIEQYRAQAHDQGAATIEAFYKSLHAASRAAEAVESHIRHGKPEVFDASAVGWLEMASNYAAQLAPDTANR